MGLIRLIFSNVLILALTGAFFYGCAPHRQDISGHPETPGDKPGQLITAEGLNISAQDWASYVQNADYILIGESHTNTCDHQVQAELINALVQAGVMPALGLEMLDVTVQDKLDVFNAGKLEANKLADKLNWSEQWGYRFSIYAPIFELARKYSLPVAALNLPRELIRQVRSQDINKLNKEKRSLLPERIIPALKEQKESLAKVYEQHQKLMHESGSSWQRFLLVQSLWDTQMAE